MKYHFQVVCLDKKGFILGYKNFNEIDTVIEDVNYMIAQSKVNKIEITRWNDKGEKV